MSELELLARAHALFLGESAPVAVGAPDAEKAVAALGAGATLWGVASDDAHAYDGVGRYPAGGAWVMVDAPRDADAIIAAL